MAIKKEIGVLPRMTVSNVRELRACESRCTACRVSNINVKHRMLQSAKLLCRALYSIQLFTTGWRVESRDTELHKKRSNIDHVKGFSQSQFDA
jgi:hypothetical protein